MMFFRLLTRFLMSCEMYVITLNIINSLLFITHKLHTFQKQVVSLRTKQNI